MYVLFVELSFLIGSSPDYSVFVTQLGNDYMRSVAMKIYHIY